MASVAGAVEGAGLNIRAGFEIGAHYDWLYDLLREYCGEVFVIDPGQFAPISRSQRKTDKIDAQKIAEGVRRGDLPLVHVPDKQTRADRRLVAFKQWHSQQMSSVKGKIRSLLLMYRLESPFSDVAGEKSLAWLKEQAAHFDVQGQMILDMLLEQAELIQQQRKELDKRVKECADSYPQAKILDSVPGLGSLGILAFVSTIAGIERFDRPEQLSSYFGVCKSLRQSGQTARRGNQKIELRS